MFVFYTAFVIVYFAEHNTAMQTECLNMYFGSFHRLFCLIQSFTNSNNLESQLFHINEILLY